MKYTRLIEDAYNFRVVDPALSDFSEFKATLVLNKLNKLNFVISDKQLQEA